MGNSWTVCNCVAVRNGNLVRRPSPPPPCAQSLAVCHPAIRFENAVYAGNMLGVSSLAAVSLANLTGNLTGLSLILGLCSAVDTLAPQVPVEHRSLPLHLPTSGSLKPLPLSLLLPPLPLPLPLPLSPDLGARRRWARATLPKWACSCSAASYCRCACAPVCGCCGGTWARCCCCWASLRRSALSPRRCPPVPPARLRPSFHPHPSAVPQGQLPGPPRHHDVRGGKKIPLLPGTPPPPPPCAGTSAVASSRLRSYLPCPICVCACVCACVVCVFACACPK